MSRNQARPHLEFQELLYLESDGELTSSEGRDLEAHVAGCGECRDVGEELSALTSLMAESKIEADPDLARRVLENLPPADWEMRRPANWRAAAAAFVGLLVGAWVLTFKGQPLGEAGPWIGTLTAMAELFRSAALAGAGLLSASWTGVGLAVGEVLSRSWAGFAVFGLFVLGIDLLFVRYVWRLSRREAAEAVVNGRGRRESD